MSLRILKYSSVDGVLFNKDKSSLLVYPCGKAGSYTIPTTIDSISSGFRNCIGLTSIVIPSSVNYIGTGAFENCTSLDSITINGDSVIVENYAFAGCKSLKQITCKGKYPPIYDDVNNNCFGSDVLAKALIYAQAKLSVPAASFKLYRLMEPWKNFDTEAYDFDMQVVSATNSAAFTWTPTSGAEKYELTICSDAANTDTVCILTFNAYGQLTALALRSASTDSVSYVDGFSFTVSSLGSNTVYYYSMDALGLSDQVVANKTGDFRTATTTNISTTGANNINVLVKNEQVVVNGTHVGDIVVVYNLHGSVVYKTTSVGASVNIPLTNRGVYVS